jgi:hypothetical protein
MTEAVMKQQPRNEKPGDLRVGLICLARTAFDFDLARRMAAQARERLARVTGSLVVPQDVMVLCGTFASAEMALHLAERRQVPLGVWTVPETELGDDLHLNSLAGRNDGQFTRALGRCHDVLGLARALHCLRDRHHHAVVQELLRHPADDPAGMRTNRRRGVLQDLLPDRPAPVAVRGSGRAAQQGRRPRRPVELRHGRGLRRGDADAAGRRARESLLRQRDHERRGQRIPR